MKVIVAGSRDFINYKVVEDTLNNLGIVVTEIVSGGARGADRLGERYAKENKILLKIFPADWDKHGKSAGYLRNKEMADYADALVAFWDGKSKGTQHMINLANRNSLLVKVIKFKS